MKQMKDYYRYFYEDRIPLLQTPLKMYDNSPTTKRRSCELYVNSINSTVMQAQQNVNPADFQERSCDLPMNYPSFNKAQYSDTSPVQIHASDFINRTYIGSGVSGGSVQNSTLSFEGERELLHTYSEESNSSSIVDVRTNNVLSGEEPMDLTVDLTYSEDMRIFEGISPQITGSNNNDEEVLDLSIKSSQKTQLGIIPEINNNTNGSSSSMMLQRNLNENLLSREPTYQQNGHQWGPPTTNETHNVTYQRCPPNTSPVSANTNSIMYNILKEREISKNMNGLKSDPRMAPMPSTNDIAQTVFNMQPGAVHPEFPPTEFKHKNHHLIPRVGQQTFPSPEGYRKLPLSPTNSIGSGSLPPPSPPSPPCPTSKMAPRYPCPRKPVKGARPTLSGSILREMGIQTRFPASLSSSSNSSPVPSDSGSLSGERCDNKAEDVLDVVKVQNVYVNYLRQLLRNVEDGRLQKDNKNPGDEMTESSSKNTEQITSSAAQITRISKLEQKCQDLMEQAERSSQVACQNDRPCVNKMQNEQLNRNTEKNGTDTPIHSDIMAIIQAEILKKSLCPTTDDKEEINSHKMSGMDLIHSLIEDEFKKLNC